ncbi:MFS domain-containing protein [Aphelenchoides bicaudatus]|nr:MFS domain-containing protein [Aphelenchoides bicaudatus]
MEQKQVISIIIFVSIAAIAPVGYHISGFYMNYCSKCSGKNFARGSHRRITSQLRSCFDANKHEYFVGLYCRMSEHRSTVWMLGFNAIFELFRCQEYSLLIANNTILLIGSIVLFLSYYVQTTILLIFGRILIGVYTGLATGLLPIYVQELAPTQIKGSLSCFIHIAVLVGAAVAALFSLETFWGTSSLWHFLLALPGVSVVFQTIYAKYLPHTPGYYLSKGELTNAADSARYYYDLQCCEDATAVQTYRSLVAKMPEQRSFKEAIRNKHARKGIALGMLVSATQILSGTMAIAYYSNSMFESISIVSSLTNLFPFLGAIFSILLSLPALKLVESCGRRPLLIQTLIMCALANFLLFIFSISIQYFDLKNTKFGLFSSTAVTLSFLLLGVGYNLGVGPVAYFVCVELVDVHFVSVAMSCTIAVNWITNMITTLVYYPFNQAVGGYSYLMFAIPTTLCVLILQKYLPETKFVRKLETSQVQLACNAQHADDAVEQQRTYRTFSSA